MHVCAAHVHMASSVNVCICLHLLVFVFVSMFVDDTVGHQGGIAVNVRKQLI